MDLSSYQVFNHNTLSGDTNTKVKFGVIQELDANKNVVFEWHSKDHFLFSETDYNYLFNPSKVDLTHCNAVALDYDGNYLLSSRQYNEITKINRSDSSIIWRLGGKANQFTFINDSIHFRRQHDIRRIANGNITLYDNGYVNPFQPATAKEYMLDETQKTATLVWSYIHDSTRYSNSRGNVQRLPNGNTVINYGEYYGVNLVFNCVNPAGMPVFEVKFIDTCLSYRAFNFPVLPWNLNRPKITCTQINGQVFLSVDSGLSSYIWSNGATTNKIAITNADTFFVFVPRGSGGFIKSELFIVSNLSNPCQPCTLPVQPSVITGSSYGLCGKQGVNYFVSAVNGMTYNWSLDNTNASISTGQGSNAIKVNFSSVYSSGTLSVVATNACGSSSKRSLFIKAVPKVPLAISGANVVCQNQQGVPYSIAAVSSATTYTWTGPNGSRFSDGITTSLSSVFSTISSSVTVNFKTTSGFIKVKANNACGSGINQSLPVIFNCREQNLSDARNLFLSVAPNPIHDNLNVSFVLNKEEAFELRLIDLTGRLLLTYRGSGLAGENHKQLNISYLSKGTYLLKLYTDSGSKILRLVVD